MLPRFTCCHQTYNYVRPWPTPPGELPLVTQIHAAPPLNLAEPPNFNGVYQVCKHCMLTQSTQVGCSCAWALAFIQSHKLVQLCPRRSHTTLPRERCPPSCTPICTCLHRECTETPWIFPQNLLYVSGDFHTFGPFPERVVIFQVIGTVYDA